VLFTPKFMPVYNFSVNIDFLDFTSTPMYSFADIFDFLDFTFSVSTKGKRLYQSRYYVAVLETAPFLML
jgi:hypothetical protein